MKNISNQISVEASNIIAVVNDKGGVGKSVLSKYVLATSTPNGRKDSSYGYSIFGWRVI